VVTPTPSPTPTPTPSPTPTVLANGLPATLPNSWESDSEYDKLTENVISIFNQTFPDANVEGSTYRDPEGVKDGVLVFMVAEERIEPAWALAAFSTEEKLTQPGIYTRCGQTTKGGADFRVGCVTETDPSVMALYFADGEDAAFSRQTLGKFVAEYQADI
jgi:hypothetical protein